MAITPGEITWIVSEDAAGEIADVRDTLGEADYKEDVRALRQLLCDYFSNVGCAAPFGKTISTLGTTSAGGKILKVRWARPGTGKSGGLRLGFVVFCDDRKVVLAKATIRRDASDDELLDSASDADEYQEDDSIDD